MDETAVKTHDPYPDFWKKRNQSPHDKTNKMTCALSEDSGQPGHPPSLIRVFAVCMKTHWALNHLLSTWWRLWSDWVDAQADQSLRWVHMSFCWFCRAAAQISCCCVVVLWFYGPSTLFRSFQVWSVNLSTLFLGKPNVCALFYANKFWGKHLGCFQLAFDEKMQFKIACPLKRTYACNHCISLTKRHFNITGNFNGCKVLIENSPQGNSSTSQGLLNDTEVTQLF